MSTIPVLEKTPSARDCPGTNGDLEKSPKPAIGLVPPDARQHDVGSDAKETDDVDGVDKSQIPWQYKWTAFSMIILFAFGSYFEGVFGPLKSTLLKELEINNAQYGAIASATNLINTVLPIVGGIGIDYYGATWASIICSVFILVGAIISSIGPVTGHFGWVLGGRILMGLGSTIIESVQNKLLAHWFSGSHLALVSACDIAWSRIQTIITRSTAVPLSQIGDHWGWAFYVPTIICAANLALCVGYYYFERNVPKQYRPLLGREARDKEGWDKRKFVFRSLFRLPKFFWILCGTRESLFSPRTTKCFKIRPFQYTPRTSPIYRARLAHGTSKLAAGYNSSLQGVIPIVLTPAVGWFFDHYGWRMAFVSWTGALYIVVFALLGFTTVHPLCPILLSSFALSTNAISFIASIPVLVGDDALLGTAMGVWKAFANCNTTVLEVAAGAIQDRTPGKTYDRVIIFLIVIKALQVGWGFVYHYLDGRWLNCSLRSPEKRRYQTRREGKATDGDLPGFRVSKLVSYTVAIQLGCLIVAAWALYITFSLGT